MPNWPKGIRRGENEEWGARELRRDIWVRDSRPFSTNPGLSHLVEIVGHSLVGQESPFPWSLAVSGVQTKSKPSTP